MKGSIIYVFFPLPLLIGDSGCDNWTRSWNSCQHRGTFISSVSTTLI